MQLVDIQYLEYWFSEFKSPVWYASMAELVVAQHLKCCLVRGTGSTPVGCTCEYGVTGVRVSLKNSRIWFDSMYSHIRKDNYSGSRAVC